MLVRESDRKACRASEIPHVINTHEGISVRMIFFLTHHDGHATI